LIDNYEIDDDGTLLRVSSTSARICNKHISYNDDKLIVDELSVSVPGFLNKSTGGAMTNCAIDPIIFNGL